MDGTFLYKGIRDKSDYQWCDYEIMLQELAQDERGWSRSANGFNYLSITSVQ